MADTAVFSVALLALGMAAVVAVVQWPLLGWPMIAAAVWIDSDAPPRALVGLGGLSIYPPDVISVLLLVAAIGHAKTLGRNVRTYSFPLAALLLLLSTSFVLGFSTMASLSAIGEFRQFLYIFALMLWALSLDWEAPRTQAAYRRWIVIAGVGLLVVFAIGVATKGINSSSDYYVDAFGDVRTLRPVVAGQACFLAFVGLYSLWAWLGRRSAWWLLFATLSLGAVVIAQHRTVWAATAAGLIVLLASHRPRTRTFPLVSGSLVLAIGWVFVAAGSYLSDILNSSLSSALNGGGGTFAARTESWSSLITLSIERGWFSMLLGQPFGAGFARTDSTGHLITYMPHNWYVSLYLRAGLLGLVAFVAIIVRMIREAGRARDSLRLMTFALLLVYCIAYSMPFYLAPVFGYALLFRGVGAQGRSEHADAGPADLQVGGRPADAWLALRKNGRRAVPAGTTVGGVMSTSG